MLRLLFFCSLFALIPKGSPNSLAGCTPTRPAIGPCRHRLMRSRYLLRASVQFAPHLHPSEWPYPYEPYYHYITLCRCNLKKKKVPATPPLHQGEVRLGGAVMNRESVSISNTLTRTYGPCLPLGQSQRQTLSRCYAPSAGVCTLCHTESPPMRGVVGPSLQTR